MKVMFQNKNKCFSENQCLIPSRICVNNFLLIRKKIMFQTLNVIYYDNWVDNDAEIFHYSINIKSNKYLKNFAPN